MIFSRNSNVELSLVWPAAIFFISFFVRFIFISQGPYHVDCLNLALQAQKTVETHQLQFSFGSGYPLNVLLAALFVGIFRLFGSFDPVLAVNFMSVVFGALGTAAFFVLLRSIFNATAAWLGAGLFCFNPVLWGTSVYGMNHSPSLFFLIAALYFLFRDLKNGKSRNLTIAAMFIGLMGATRLQDMVLMTPAFIFAIAFLLQEKPVIRGGDISRFLLIASVIVAFFHAPYWMGHQSSGYGQQWHEYWKQGFTQFDGRAFLYFQKAYDDFLQSVSFLGLVLSLAGLVLIFRDKPKFAFFITLWLVVPFLFFSSLAGTAPRFLAVILPATLVLQVYALIMYMKEPLWQRVMALAVWAVVLGQSVTLMFPILNYRHNRAEIMGASQWMGRITPANSIIFAGDEGPFILHYGRRQTLKPPICWAGCTQDQFQDFKKSIKDFNDQGRPVYITSMGLQADDPDGEFQRYVAANFNLSLAGKCWTEDWHHDCMVLRLGWVKLFKITVNE